MTRIALVLLALLLTVALFACDKNQTPDTTEEPSVTNNETNNENNQTVNTVTKTGMWADAIHTTDKTFGEGAITIQLEVKAEEQSLTFTIKTNKETLADALLEHELIEGEDGAYGIYIKKVNGIVADYDIDQTYWSLSKGGQMSMVGAGDTVIANGEHYELTRAK